MKKISLLFLLFLVPNILFAQMDYVVKAAEQGDLSAQKYLARVYTEGRDGKKKDYAIAYRWLKAAAEQGDNESMHQLAMWDHYTHGGEWKSIEEIEKCQKLLKRPAANRYAPSEAMLGFMYMVEKKYIEAYNLLEDAASQGYSDCYYALSCCYFEGLGTKKDIKKAIYYCEKAILEAGGEWNSRLAEMYIADGQYNKVESTYLDGIKQGDVQCYLGLAKAYADGSTGSKNFRKAHEVIDVVIRNYPSEPEPLAYKGQFFLDANDMEGASEIWKSIKKVDAEYAEKTDNSYCVAMRAFFDESVDANIYETAKQNPFTYVVIIANENYKREIAVPYAINDGAIFAKYCEKTLGVPHDNIQFIQDATYNDIRFSVNWLRNISEASGDTSKIIFYYAGHGIPDERQKDAYLLPVDGFDSEPSTWYKLADLYENLGHLPSKSVVVLLDACFSGTKRDGTMLTSARGVAIKVQDSQPVGNMLIFSASTGDETAYPYEEQRHGLFTYYLLKKLQDSKGEATFGEIGDYVTSQVRQQSLIRNKKNQTPTINSKIDASVWRKWKLN